ncbi:MAG: hypothetical protein K2O04_05905, partial [Clostridiales bacterium]|nr:hypothetical protein [Clostridiales bacterium]
MASVLFALVCCACLFLLGCSDGESDQPAVIFSVCYQASDGGYIDGEAAQEVKYDQNASSVKAIPNEGYEFKEWSDGVTEALRTDNNVQADITVSAIF